MRPYARRGQKIRINNRSKFNAGARRISREFSPSECPPKVVPLHLVMTRLRKATRQGLTKDQRRAYIVAMV
jgi:hypothetical protein